MTLSEIKSGLTAAETTVSQLSSLLKGLKKSTEALSRSEQKTKKAMLLVLKAGEKKTPSPKKSKAGPKEPRKEGSGRPKATGRFETRSDLEAFMAQARERGMTVFDIAANANVSVPTVRKFFSERQAV